jgi:hypothetical protein
LLKAEHPLPATAAFTAFDSLTLLALAFELALGLLLVLRPTLRFVQLSALITFAVFACVAAYKAILGASSCGCFGALTVPPGYVASFDLLTVLGFASLPTSSAKASAVDRPRAWLASLAIIAVAGTAAVAMRNRAAASAALADSGELSASGLVLLEPEQWVTKPLPLLKHLLPADGGTLPLERGCWTAVLYHHDCPTCLELLPGLEPVARAADGSADHPRVALIEMPPYAPPGESPVPPGSACLRLKLSDAREWFATTPVVLQIRDGVVLAAAQGEEAKKLVVPDSAGPPR